MANQKNTKIAKKSNTVQKDIDSILVDGVKYFEERNYEMAISVFSEAIEYDNNNFEAIYNRGVSFKNNRNLDAAINDFEICVKLLKELNKITDLKTFFISTHYLLGDCYYLKFNYSKAIYEFSIVIQYYLKHKNSDNFDDMQVYLSNAYFSRATIYMLKENYSKAIIDIEKSINFNKQEILYFTKFMILVFQKRYKQILKESSKLLENNPRDMYLYSFNASSLLEIGEEIKAKKVIEKAFRYKPSLIIKKDDDFINDPINVINQLFFLGLCIFAEKFNLALKYVNNFIKYYPDIAILYFIKSIIYLIKEDEGKSIKNFRIFYQKKNQKVKIGDYSLSFIVGLNKGPELFPEIFENFLLGIINKLSSSYSISVNYIIEFIFTIFSLDVEISEKMKFTNAAKYFDSLYENFPNVEEVKQIETEFIKKIFSSNYPVDNLNVLDTIKKDGKERFRTVIKLCFLSVLLKKELENKKSNHSQPLFDIYFNLNKELLRNLRHTIEIKEIKNAQIEVESVHQVAQAKIEAEEKAHKEMLSFFTHTLNNALGTGDNTIQDIIMDFERDKYIKNKEINIYRLNSLFANFSLIRSLIKSYKIYIQDPEFFKTSWEKDSSGDANINWVFVYTLRQVISQLLFVKDPKILNRLQMGARNFNNKEEMKKENKRIRKSFINDVLLTKINKDNISEILSWFTINLPFIKLEIKAPKLNFGLENIRFGLFFACFSEIINNALKYSDGKNPIELKWEKDSKYYIFQSRNTYNSETSFSNDIKEIKSQKGIHFIERLMNLFACSKIKSSELVKIDLDDNYFVCSVKYPQNKMN